MMNPQPRHARINQPLSSPRTSGRKDSHQGVVGTQALDQLSEDGGHLTAVGDPASQRFLEVPPQEVGQGGFELPEFLRLGLRDVLGSCRQRHQTCAPDPGSTLEVRHLFLQFGDALRPAYFDSPRSVLPLAMPAPPPIGHVGELQTSGRAQIAREFSGDLGSNVPHCSLGQCSNSKLDNSCKRVGTPSYLYEAKQKQDITGPRSSGKHGNATMLQLRLATSGEVLSAAIGREPCRVPEPHRCLHSKLVFEGTQRRSGVVGPVTPSAASETILHAAQESLHARNTQKQVRKLEMVLIEGFCVGGVLTPLRKKNFSLTCCLPPIVEFVCNQLCGLMCDIPSPSSSALKSFNMH